LKVFEFMAHNIDYKKIVLPNGLTCVLYQRPEVHSVDISVDVEVGALDETAEINGISHMVEHLPFDGTKEMPSWEKVDEFNNSISGSSNAYTSSAQTSYYGHYPCQYFEDALFYLSQLVFHPLHTEEDLVKEKDIIVDELKTRADSVDFKIYRNIIDNRYLNNNTPYSFDVIGTETNVKGFTKQNIAKHHKKYYVPENIKVFIVGNFEYDKAEKYLKKYFYTDLKDRKFAKKPVRKFQKTYPEYSKFKMNTVQKGDLDQYYLTLTFPRPEFKKTLQTKRIKLPFLSSLTASGQYQQSILWKRLREELGIVYGVSAYGWDYFNRAFTIIETSFQPQYLEQVLQEIYDGINQIKSAKVADTVFKTRQKRIVDTELMIYDSPSNVLNWIMDQENEYEYHKEFLTPTDFIELVKKLDFSEVVEMANEVYDWDKVNIGIVSKDDPSEVQKKLESIWQKITKNG